VAPDAALIDYLVGTMGDCPREQVRILYLDSGNRLIRDEIGTEGTPTQAFIAPRAIIARALDLEATALLVVHNHPGGTPYPTRTDIDFTAHLARVAKDLGLVLHDHLIIAGDSWQSLRANGVFK
jgi:DNA repair protein RadC